MIDEYDQTGKDEIFEKVLNRGRVTMEETFYTNLLLTLIVRLVKKITSIMQAAGGRQNGGGPFAAQVPRLFIIGVRERSKKRA